MHNDMNPPTEFDRLLLKAYQAEGAEKEVNTFYTFFLRSSMFVPIEKLDENAELNPEEPFRPLFITHEQQTYMVCFSTLERLKTWAGPYFGEMGYVNLLGRDIIRSIGMQVFLACNYDTPFYKEFVPEEIEKLKQVVGRLDRMAERFKPKDQ